MKMKTRFQNIILILKSIFKFIPIMIAAQMQLISLSKNHGINQVGRLNNWFKLNFSSPAPNIVKWNVMERWGGHVAWIETGTYLGETTTQLSKNCILVISIEPEKSLFKNAEHKFRNTKNIVLLNGTSESKLREAINMAKMKKLFDVSFWLDGHFSEGLTYLGESECPVLFELTVIADEFKGNFPITILIDDIRNFSPTNQIIRGYPSLTYLVEYANKNNLFWTIEHDIFIMTNRNINS